MSVVPFGDQSEHRRRDGYRIVIQAGLWKGCEVVVEPATASHGLRRFATHEAAMEAAEALRKLEGWPILDRTGDDTPPRAA